MKTISASEFKARCLAVLAEVHSTGEPVLVAKRDRPVARLMPAGKPPKFIGRLKGIIKIVGDIESPTEAWESASPAVESGLRRHLRKRARTSARDLKRIDHAAKRLNNDDADVLDYQAGRTAPKKAGEGARSTRASRNTPVPGA
jgi:prevent-host-death family protein